MRPPVAMLTVLRVRHRRPGPPAPGSHGGTAVGAIARVPRSWLRGGSVGRLSRAAWLYIGVVVAAAAAVVVRGPVRRTSDWCRNVVVLGLLFVVCDSTATLLTPRQLGLVANSAATLAAVGPARPGRRRAGRRLHPVRPAPRPVGRPAGCSTRACTPCQRVPGRAGFLALGGHIGVPGRRVVPGHHRAVRGRRRGARGRQPRAAAGRALADQRPRGAAAARPLGHEHQAARVRPRLRRVRPADRRAVERGRAVRAGAGADPAVRGPLGGGAVRRAAAGLRGHGGRAVPGGGDQGLLHPRAQRAGVPRARS